MLERHLQCCVLLLQCVNVRLANGACAGESRAAPPTPPPA